MRHAIEKDLSASQIIRQLMKEELEAEIATMEDEIKSVMGEEETLLAGAFKVTWTPYTSSRFDSTRFKKEHAELAAAYTKTTTTRRFSVR